MTNDQIREMKRFRSVLEPLLSDQSVVLTKIDLDVICERAYLRGVRVTYPYDVEEDAVGTDRGVFRSTKAEFSEPPPA